MRHLEQVGQSSAQKRRNTAPPGGNSVSSLRAPAQQPKRGGCCSGAGPSAIVVENITYNMLLDVARKTEGFSGRAMAKMLLNLQGAVYAEEDCRLTPAVMQQVVKQELIKHRARTGEDGLPARDLMRSPVRRGRNGVAGGAKHASAAAATAAGPPGDR